MDSTSQLTCFELRKSIVLQSRRYGEVKYILISPAAFSELMSDRNAKEHVTMKQEGSPHRWHHEFDDIPLLIDKHTKGFKINHEVPEVL